MRTLFFVLFFSSFRSLFACSSLCGLRVSVVSVSIQNRSVRAGLKDQHGRTGVVVAASERGSVSGVGSPVVGQFGIIEKSSAYVERPKVRRIAAGVLSKRRRSLHRRREP
jgi:hypothetical protein